MLSNTNQFNQSNNIANNVNKVKECGICGRNHLYSECNDLKISLHVPDKEVPSKARLSCPEFLDIRRMSDCSFQVFTKIAIKKGTLFGPFQAQKILTLNPCIHFPLKVFLSSEEDFSEYFLDTSDEFNCSWMIFVNAASELDEQNMMCFQNESNIYYAATKDIKEEEMLKVWYAPYYASKMKKSVLKPNNEQNVTHPPPVDLNLLIKEQQKIMVRDSWNCKFCGKVEQGVAVFASHLLDHYKAQLRKICEICKEVFHTRKLLKKHMKIVHGTKLLINSSKPEAKTSSPSTNKEQKELAVGGPLLNDIMTDSLDNSNILLQQTEDLNQFDFDSDNLNLTVDNLLMNENVKILDHFNFEINDTEEQIVCDICLKSFAKLRSLISHIYQHTGKFHCSECNKIFCRKENLKEHTCNKAYSFKCDQCGKVFHQLKYLRQHKNAVHIQKVSCPKCLKTYTTKYELQTHHCVQLTLAEKPKFVCTVCEKVFFREKYLKLHAARHDGGGTAKPERNAAKVEIMCSVCAIVFKSRATYASHMAKHGEPRFSCSICSKKFHKMYVLKNHLQTHSVEVDSFEEECTVCKKKFRTKKLLQTHMFSHSNDKQYKCTTCNAEFKFRASLFKHMKTIHSDNTDSNKSELRVYDCPKCGKTMKLKNSLTRHIKTHHVDSYKQEVLQNIKPRIVQLDNDNKPVTEPNDADLNIMETIENMDFSDMGNNNSNEIEDINIENILSETSENIVELESLLSLPTTSAIVTESREVCLSMPDLADSNSEIQLGRNAYILENGTIVEPQENSDKVIIYMLD